MQPRLRLLDDVNRTIESLILHILTSVTALVMNYKKDQDHEKGSVQKQLISLREKRSLSV